MRSRSSIKSSSRVIVMRCIAVSWRSHVSIWIACYTRSRRWRSALPSPVGSKAAGRCSLLLCGHGRGNPIVAIQPVDYRRCDPGDDENANDDKAEVGEVVVDLADPAPQPTVGGIDQRHAGGKQRRK